MPYIPLPHSARSGADMPSIPHTPGMHSSARVPQAPNLPAAAVSPNVPHIEIGHLVVFVTAADGAIPLENALVTVSALSQNGVSELLFTTRTNKSGRTTTLPLPAPPRSNSLSPGGKNCCAQYTVSVDHDDFHSVVYSNISIYADVVSTFPVLLMPRGGTKTDPSLPIEFSIPPHNLLPKE